MTRRATVGLGSVMVVAVITLGAGYLLKDRCTTAVWDGIQYRSSCYSDVIALYGARGLNEEPIPYINGDGELADPEVGDLEYPVGTGYAVAVAASASSDFRGFYQATSILLALAGLIAAHALARTARDPNRALLFVGATSVVLYAFHNWDLLAVAALALALAAFARERDTWAGVALGIGTATKLFPGIALPVLALARWREGKKPWGMIGAAAAAFVAMNLPILLANPAGWLLPWRFQSTRFPNFETSWYFLFRHLGSGTEFWVDVYPRLTGVASGLLFLAGFGLLLRAEARRERFRPYVTVLGGLLIFLLTAKVYSPQFALWVLPLFALVRLPLRAYVAFLATDAAVWFSISAYLLSLQYGAGDPDIRLWILEATVFIRYGVLAWILVLSRGATDDVIGLEEPEPAGEQDGPERDPEREGDEQRLV